MSFCDGSLLSSQINLGCNVCRHVRFELPLSDPNDLQKVVGRKVESMQVESKQFPHLYGQMLLTEHSGTAVPSKRPPLETSEVHVFSSTGYLPYVDICVFLPYVTSHWNRSLLCPVWPWGSSLISILNSGTLIFLRFHAERLKQEGIDGTLGGGGLHKLGMVLDFGRAMLCSPELHRVM